MDILRPYGQLDLIYYYTKISEKLKKFLKNKEIATRIWLPKKAGIPYIIKRGSKDGNLYIEQFKVVNKNFFEIRNKIKSLTDARKYLTKEQILMWDYFVPRKLIDMHYAVNGEGANKKLDRIYFDIDRKDSKAEKAQLVAKELINIIKKDRDFKLKYKFFVLWTGNSFHVYLLLKNKITHDYYEKYIHVEKKDSLESFTSKWAKKIKVKNVEIIGGHEKEEGKINIDPSQSPSGKLGRVPFSLHIKNNKIDGIAIPLTVKDLDDKDLIKRLQSYDANKVIKELDKLAKKLP